MGVCHIIRHHMFTERVFLSPLPFQIATKGGVVGGKEGQKPPTGLKSFTSHGGLHQISAFYNKQVTCHLCKKGYSSLIY